MPIKVSLGGAEVNMDLEERDDRFENSYLMLPQKWSESMMQMKIDMFTRFGL